jgi:hypothetical protein
MDRGTDKNSSPHSAWIISEAAPLPSCLGCFTLLFFIASSLQQGCSCWASALEQLLHGRECNSQLYHGDLAHASAPIMHADCFRLSRAAMRANPGCVSDAQLQSSHWCYFCRGRSSAVAKIPVVTGSRSRVLSTTVMATAATQVGGCVGTETCDQANAQQLRTYKEDVVSSSYTFGEPVASGSVRAMI